MKLANEAKILAEVGEISGHQVHDGLQHIFQIRAPEIAARSNPGQFVHVDCGPEWLLRRPMSIMQAGEDTIEILFKEVGHGTRWLASRKIGDAIDLLGPIGNTFTPVKGRPIRVLLGGGVGIPPILYFADQLSTTSPQPWVIAGSELPFPFETESARFSFPGVEKRGYDSIARLQARAIPNRLCSMSALPGTFRGYVTDLAESLLSSLGKEELQQVSLYACGPTPMLKATADLARRHTLPCQLSLEEYMACGVGGCAGCVVEVVTSAGAAMQRVCVDGPIFDSSTVFKDLSRSPDAEEPTFE